MLLNRDSSGWVSLLFQSYEEAQRVKEILEDLIEIRKEEEKNENTETNG